MTEYGDSLNSTLKAQKPTIYAVLMKTVGIDPQRANHLDSLIRLAFGMDTPVMHVMVLDEAKRIEATGLFDRAKMHEGLLNKRPPTPISTSSAMRMMHTAGGLSLATL